MFIHDSKTEWTTFEVTIYIYLQFVNTWKKRKKLSRKLQVDKVVDDTNYVWKL